MYLPLQSLTDFQRSLLIMKPINDKVPQYIKALFNLCPNGNNRFRLSLPRLDIFKSHRISFSAIMSWNSLPINRRSSMRSISLNNLKENLVIISLVKYNYITFETINNMIFTVYFKRPFILRCCLR